ncbi:class I SAM-dependent methyltransferase [Sphingobium sp. 3R8]|uniref:class I SAM-dependent methyltransferase n=1 Tax=Sphingobium sp. 3R8 TaxID=2874921 RepID=UPI001CCAE432|nr:class I SAM-dependent methyltransferase [Sphingobium sp. 3R8]MBZ9650254.1 class I SAM-dependent methyltransferase [Sphingobium sp. 3R8]
MTSSWLEVATSHFRHFLAILKEVSMHVAVQGYDEQAALWNGQAGEAWAAEQDLLDTMFKPLEDRLVEAIWMVGPKALLDVGCGTGATTLAAALLRGDHGSSTGIDVSAPMLGLARSRAAAEHSPARFILADAQTYPFGAASFDMIVSRFGVMFFADPVAAFQNLRRASRATAQMRLLAWRSAAENPFMTAAENAAAPLLGTVPPRAGGPGQFAFADPAYVRSVLGRSGWAAVELRPINVTCSFPASELERFFTRLGPLGRVLGDVADPSQRAAIVERVRTAFEPFLFGGEVRFVAACWMISARACPAYRERIDD